MSQKFNEFLNNFSDAYKQKNPDATDPAACPHCMGKKVRWTFKYKGITYYVDWVPTFAQKYSFPICPHDPVHTYSGEKPFSEDVEKIIQIVLNPMSYQDLSHFLINTEQTSCYTFLMERSTNASMKRPRAWKAVAEADQTRNQTKSTFADQADQDKEHYHWTYSDWHRNTPPGFAGNAEWHFPMSTGSAKHDKSNVARASWHRTLELVLQFWELRNFSPVFYIVSLALFAAFCLLFFAIGGPFLVFCSVVLFIQLSIASIPVIKNWKNTANFQQGSLYAEVQKQYNRIVVGVTVVYSLFAAYYFFLIVRTIRELYAKYESRSAPENQGSRGIMGFSLILKGFVSMFELVIKHTATFKVNRGIYNDIRQACDGVIDIVRGYSWISEDEDLRLTSLINQGKKKSPTWNEWTKSETKRTTVSRWRKDVVTTQVVSIVPPPLQIWDPKPDDHFTTLGYDKVDQHFLYIHKTPTWEKFVSEQTSKDRDLDDEFLFQIDINVEWGYNYLSPDDRPTIKTRPENLLYNKVFTEYVRDDDTPEWLDFSSNSIWSPYWYFPESNFYSVAPAHDFKVEIQGISYPRMLEHLMVREHFNEMFDIFFNHVDLRFGYSHPKKIFYDHKGEAIKIDDPRVFRVKLTSVLKQLFDAEICDNEALNQPFLYCGVALADATSVRASTSFWRVLPDRNFVWTQAAINACNSVPEFVQLNKMLIRADPDNNLSICVASFLERNYMNYYRILPRESKSILAALDFKIKLVHSCYLAIKTKPDILTNAGIDIDFNPMYAPIIEILESSMYIHSRIYDELKSRFVNITTEEVGTRHFPLAWNFDMAEIYAHHIDSYLAHCLSVTDLHAQHLTAAFRQVNLYSNYRFIYDLKYAPVEYFGNDHEKMRIRADYKLQESRIVRNHISVFSDHHLSQYPHPWSWTPKEFFALDPALKKEVEDLYIVVDMPSVNILSADFGIVINHKFRAPDSSNYYTEVLNESESDSPSPPWSEEEDIPLNEQTTPDTSADVSSDEFEDKFVEEDATPGSHEWFEQKEREDSFRSYLGEHKWTILAFGIISAFFLVMIAFFWKRSKNSPIVVDEGNYFPEGKKRGHQQKRGGVREHFDDDDDHDDDRSSKGPKKSKEQIKQDERRAAQQRKENYDNTVSNKEEFQVQLGYSLSDNTKLRWDRVDGVFLNTGSMEPEKLLDYDSVVVRIGPYNATINQKGADRIQLFQKIGKVASRFKRPVLVQPAAGKPSQNFMQLVTQPTPSSIKEGGLFLTPEFFQRRAAQMKITLEEDELMDIVQSKNPLRRYNEVIAEKLRKRMQSDVVTNEGMLGKVLLNPEQMISNQIRLFNNTNGINFWGAYVKGKLITVAHGVYNLEMSTNTPGKIQAYKYKESDPTLDFKVVKVSRQADWAILGGAENAKRSSYSPHLNDYEGPGVIVSKEINGQPHFAFGVVFKKGNMLYHHIPTVAGHSGLLIFDMAGKVLGIHKGYTGLTNVGVPIDVILEEKEDAVINDDDEITNQGAMSKFADDKVLNFSYLPKHMVPRVRPLPADYNPPDWVGEGVPIGTVKYNIQAYQKYSEFDYYKDTYKDFDLPPPEEGKYGIAKPTLRTIHKDFSKYTVHKDFKPNKARAAKADALFKEYLNKIVPTQLRLYTFEEALQKVNEKASTGYPVKEKSPTKGDFIEKYKDSLKAIYDAILRGEDPTVIFDQLGKEELRDLERLMNEKIRSYNSSPVHLYFIERILFGDLIDSFNKVPFFVTHATTGWSPFYGGWNDMVRYCTKDHDPRWKLFSDIDFPRWDSSCFPELFRRIGAIITEKFGIDIEVAIKLFEWWFKNAIQEALCAVPISDVEALLLFIFRGMKSGLLVTFMFNCFINTWRHFYCMVGMYPNITSLAQLEEVCAWMACGDDFSLSTCLEDFDMSVYSQYSREIALPVETWKEGWNLIFAGAETAYINNTALCLVNHPRLIYNLSIIKRGMSIADYIQKLDNLIRISVMTDIQLVVKMMAFRNSLIKRFRMEQDVLRVASGVCTLEDAIRMHVYVDEGSGHFEPFYQAGPLNTVEPDKFSQLILQHSLPETNEMNKLTKKLNKIEDDAVKAQRVINQAVAAAKVPRRSKKSKGNTAKSKKGNRKRGNRRNTSGVALVSNQQLGAQTAAVLRNIAAPGVAPAMRYNSPITTGKTAVASPWQLSDVDAPSTNDSSALDQLPTEEMFAAVFRDPVHNSVQYLANRAGATYKYTGKILYKSGQTDFSLVVGAEKFIPFGYFEADYSVASNIQPHGKYLPVGVAKGQSAGAFFMNANDKLTVNTTNLMDSVHAMIYRWEDGTFIEETTSELLSGNTWEWTSGTPGYYILSFQSGIAQPLAISSVFIQGNGSCFAHKMLSDLDLKMNSVEDVRILSQSLLYTNTSAVMDKGGKAAMWQSDGAYPWTALIPGGYSALASKNDSGRFVATNGMYGFLKPCQPSDFDMISPFDYDQFDRVARIKFQLDKEIPYLAFYFSIKNPDARDGYFTFATNMEFRTGDLWFPQEASRVSCQAYNQGLEAIKDVTQYHENPLHLKDIWDGAKKVLGAVVKYGPKVMEVANLLSTF